MVAHHLTLVNHGLSLASIKLYTEDDHFCIAGLPHAVSGGNEFTTLQPCDNISVCNSESHDTVDHLHFPILCYTLSLQFNMEFSFSCEDVKLNELTPDSSTLQYTSSLSIEFSTGAKQVRLTHTCTCTCNCVRNIWWKISGLEILFFEPS